MIISVEFLFNDETVLELVLKIHTIVNVLKTTELHTFKWLKW